MAKSKKKKAFSVILQEGTEHGLEITGRNVVRDHRPTTYSENDQLRWAVEAYGKKVSLRFKERIILSAAKTLIAGKAWLNAIACRNVFPESPAIEFVNDRPDHFGGKLEFWMENLNAQKELQMTIRITGYTQGGATIRIGSSIPAVYSLVPIDVSGSMNLTLGNLLQVPANTPGGLGLVTLEVQFHNAQYGSWRFVDVNFTEVS